MSQPKFWDAPLAKARTPVVTSTLSQQISWPMPSAQLFAAESGAEPSPSAVASTSPPGVVQGTVPVLFQVEPISVQGLVRRCARITASGPKALYSDSVAEVMVAPLGTG